MTITAEGRSRHRLVKAAAGLALVGTATGLVATGVAEAAVAPPLNVTVTDATSSTGGVAIDVNWDAPTTGDPPTYYQVIIDNTLTPLTPDITTTVSATITELRGVALLPNTPYSVVVESNNGTSLAPSPAILFTTPLGPPGSCTGEWTPFCTVDAFINQQYLDWQDRAPMLDERNFWRAALQPRSNAANGNVNLFLDTFRQDKDIKAGPVIRLYVAYFLRNPEFAGYKFWLNLLTAPGGWTMGQVSDFFAASPEFQARYGALDNASFVSLVYQNVLGRNPDAAGFSFWTRQLQAGQSRGWMMSQFTEAPSLEFQTKTAAAVAATEVYAEMLNRVPTLAEYDAATFLGIGFPLVPATVNPLYQLILNSSEYRARVVIRVPGT